MKVAPFQRLKTVNPPQKKTRGGEYLWNYCAFQNAFPHAHELSFPLPFTSYTTHCEVHLPGSDLKLFYKVI